MAGTPSAAGANVRHDRRGAGGKRRGALAEHQEHQRVAAGEVGRGLVVVEPRQFGGDVAGHLVERLRLAQEFPGRAALGHAVEIVAGIDLAAHAFGLASASGVRPPAIRSCA